MYCLQQKSTILVSMCINDGTIAKKEDSVFINTVAKVTRDMDIIPIQN